MNLLALHGTFAVILATSLLSASADAAPGTSPDSLGTPRANVRETARDREISFTEEKPAAKSGKLEGFQLQELDEPLTTLQPKTPRTITEQERIEALSWYMSGRLAESRSDFQAAYGLYQKAISHDPNSVKILQSLIQLAFSLNHADDAMKYALRAVELDPTDFRLLRRLGTFLANNKDPAGAIKLFEQALKAPDLKKESALYVTLMRDLGVLYWSSGRVKESADCLEVVFDALQHHAKYDLNPRTRKELQADPNIEYEKLGQVFLEAQRSDLAIQAFKLGAPVRNGSLSFNLAQVYLQTKQPDKALEELQKYLEQQRQSKGRAAYQLLADILEQAGKPEELLPKLEELAEKDPQNSYLMYFLAERYRQAGRLDAAEATYKKTLASSAELQGFTGLAGVYREQNKPAELLEMLSKAFVKAKGFEGLERVKGAGELDAQLKAIQKDEKLVQGLIDAGRKMAKETPPRLDFSGSFILARIAAETRQMPAAEEFYRFALSLNKDEAALIYQELGNQLQEVAQYAEAAKVYQEAVNDPAVADEHKLTFLVMLSQTQEQSGNTKGALEAIAAAQQKVPNHPQLLYWEAWIYSHSQQFDEAISRFEKLIATLSKNPDQGQKLLLRRTQLTLSTVFVQQGNLPKGEEVLESVLKDEPENATVNNDLGYLYADQGKNLEQAEVMIAKALKAEPENGAYLDSMGWVMFKRGKFAEAVQFLEKATKTEPTADATIFDHLGDAQERLKETAKALESWTKALEMARKAAKPDSKLIGRIEEKIKNHGAGAGKLRPERSQSP